jgi:hypothetical protein
MGIDQISLSARPRAHGVDLCKKKKKVVRGVESKLMHVLHLSNGADVRFDTRSSEYRSRGSSS